MPDSASRQIKHGEKQICVQFEQHIQQMLPMSRLLDFTHDNQLERTRIANVVPHAFKHLIFTCSCVFMLDFVLVGRRDKNHHCRCSHECFARTLILHARKKKQHKRHSIDFVFGCNFKCSIRSRCMENVNSTRSQCEWENSGRHIGSLGILVLIALVCHTARDALWFTLHIKNELNWKNG